MQNGNTLAAIVESNEKPSAVIRKLLNGHKSDAAETKSDTAESSEVRDGRARKIEGTNRVII